MDKSVELLKKATDVANHARITLRFPVSNKLNDEFISDHCSPLLTSSIYSTFCDGYRTEIRDRLYKYEFNIVDAEEQKDPDAVIKEMVLYIFNEEQLLSMLQRWAESSNAKVIEALKISTKIKD